MNHFRFHAVLVGLCTIASAHGQDFALKQLENSPRHHEWVRVESGQREVACFVAYPETDAKAPAVVVIHENRGLTDWVRSFADQLAAAGFLAIAPDLLTGAGPGGGKTSDFPDSDAARQAIYALDAEQVTRDLTAVQAYAAALPSSNGKTAVAGFCWGGSQSFRFATNNDQIQAALVFYGTAPQQKDDLARIQAPVYGFYGGADERVNATIPATEAAMKELGKSYERVIYPGAGHAFMRRGDDPSDSPENRSARDEAWKRLLKILDPLRGQSRN